MTIIMVQDINQTNQDNNRRKLNLRNDNLNTKPDLPIFMVFHLPFFEILLLNDEEAFPLSLVPII